MPGTTMMALPVTDAQKRAITSESALDLYGIH